MIPLICPVCEGEGQVSCVCDGCRDVHFARCDLCEGTGKLESRESEETLSGTEKETALRNPLDEAQARFVQPKPARDRNGYGWGPMQRRKGEE